ncbi:MAG: tRNA (guanosine(37)-N1)-methyltransferase TrmD [Chloroflexota bacterium]|nr:tRNA (guanosine(37)-N1)-methyltransferase TrmD [Chloroflexota bacterium]
MRIDVLTLFPEMFLGPLQESILKRGQERGALAIYLHQLRDYAFDRHQITDDTPYGGGHGMVLKPEPIIRAVETLRGAEDWPVILLTPQGRTFTQEIAQDLAEQPRLLFICGHYEGFDERVREQVVTEELSLGDYVLTGGELAAMVMIDAIARWIPGVLGSALSAPHDSYAEGLLEGPNYTRPPEFRGQAVPPVLLSGNHAAIARWKREQALFRTWSRRPELLAQAELSAEDQTYLEKIKKDNSLLRDI